MALLARIVANSKLSDRTINEQFVSDYMPPEPILYGDLAGKVGLLSSQLVLGITQFHKHYAAARHGLRLLVDRQGISFSPLVVLKPAVSAVKDVRSVLDEIERMASIQPPASDPDMGKAEEVIDMEQTFFDELAKC